MSSIAYITDSKLLEYHRLNQNKEMNFWRLSSALNFSDFKKGDLLFFLSKDKDSKRRSEKGIVGYGRCVSFHSASINTMYKRFSNLNGYPSLKSFKEAIIKVTKDHKVPAKISSIYLEDIVFFQNPIYLSDLGKNISKSLESYIYLDTNLSLKILDLAKDEIDIWSSIDVDNKTIEKEEIRYILFNIYDKIILEYPGGNKSKRALKNFMMQNPDVKYIRDSVYEAYKIEEDRLYIYMAPLYLKDDLMAKRIAFGQEMLYKKMFDELYPYNLHIIFEVIEKGE